MHIYWDLCSLFLSDMCTRICAHKLIGFVRLILAIFALFVGLISEAMVFFFYFSFNLLSCFLVDLF